MTKQAGPNAKRNKLEQMCQMTIQMTTQMKNWTSIQERKARRVKVILVMSRSAKSSLLSSPLSIYLPGFFLKSSDVDVNKTTRNIKLSSQKTVKSLSEISRNNKNVSSKKTEGTSTKRQISNKLGQIIVENKSGKEDIALNNQQDHFDKSFEEMSMTECFSKSNATKKSTKTRTGNVGLKPCATSTPNKNSISKPSCSKTLQENGEGDFDCHDDQEKDMLDRTYEPYMDIDHVSYSSDFSFSFRS